MIPIWELRSIKEAATRPEFYNFLNVGLKGLLFKAYRNAKTTYKQLVTFETSSKNKENYPSLGMTFLPEQVLEGEAFSERNLPDDDFVEVTNNKYGEIIAITQEMIDDDQTKMIKRLPMDLGNAHAKHEDKTVYSIINGNPTTYDSNLFFYSNHPGYVGGAAVAQNNNLLTAVTLTANAIAQSLGIMAQWRGHSNEDILDVTATDLVVPASLKFTADLLTDTNSLPLGQAAGLLGPGATVSATNKNPFKALSLGVISSPRLDASSTTDWYIKTDFPGLLFQWRDRLKVLQENENSGVKFERDVLRWKSRARWVTKVINWRCMMKIS